MVPCALHGRQAAVPLTFSAIALHRRLGRLVDGRRAHAHLTLPGAARDRARSLPGVAGGLDARPPASRPAAPARSRVRPSQLAGSPRRAVAAGSPCLRRVYIWTGPLRVWLWVVVLAALLAPAGDSPGSSVAGADRARPAAGAMAGRGHRRRRVPRRRLSDLSAPSDRRRAALPRHRAEPPQGSRPANRKQPSPRRLSRVLRRRSAGPTTCGAAATARSTRCTRRAFPSSSRPVLALFGYPGVLVFLALVSACATALAWTATWRVTSDAAASWFGWATAALTRAVLLPVVRRVSGRARRGAASWSACWRSSTSRTLSTRRLVVTGAALAILPWLHTRYVVAAVMLGPDRCACAAMRVPLGGIAGVLALCRFRSSARRAGSRFFYAIYGSPDPRGPYGGSTQSDLANLGRGIVGLLFDQQFGVLPAAPVLLCALAGLVVLHAAHAAAGGGASAARRAVRYRRGRVPDVVGRQQLARPLHHPDPAAAGDSGRRLVPDAPRITPAGSSASARSPSACSPPFTLASVDRGILLYNFRDGSSRLLTWLSPLVNITSGLPERLPDDAVGGVPARTGVDRGDRADRGRRRCSSNAEAPRGRRCALALGFSAIARQRRAVDRVEDHDPSGRAHHAGGGTAAFLERYDPDSAADRDPRTARSAACPCATC